jgi:hypothetical protein
MNRLLVTNATTNSTSKKAHGIRTTYFKEDEESPSPTRLPP